MRPLLPLILVSILTLGGCCDDSSGLTVRGALAIEIADAETGFSFAADTLLADEFDDLAEGSVAGHCTIDPTVGDDGEVDVAIVQPGTPDAESRELQSMGITLSEQGGEGRGEISAWLGDSAFHAEAGGSCLLELIYVNVDTGQAGLEVDCALSDDGGDEAYATAELHFHGCDLTE